MKIDPISIPNQVLRDILDRGNVIGADGQEHALSSAINPTLAQTLYEVVRARRPKIVVEVGMAHGISSLAILTALEEVGHGRLISVDPYQSTQWNRAGITSVDRAGLKHRHELIEEPDYVALPQLLSRKLDIEFSYIDGMHTFDYVLLDFFYLDKMLRPDGVLGFNDCGWRAIHKALRFVQSHRRYRELNVGLERDYRSRNPVGSLLKRLTGRSNNDRYFEKVEDWEPRWDFYRPF